MSDRPTDGTSTADHFALVAGLYAEFRPRYPPALYTWLAAIAPGTERVWDCACGSGQASVDLAACFTSVEATDVSSAQLAQASAHPRVRYQRGPAEACALPAASCDLVTVAQALHWFDCARFYAEVRRVLRAEGVLAAWCYGPFQVAPGLGAEQFAHFYKDIVGPYWPPERRHIDAAYQTLDFPRPRLSTPEFVMQADWTLAGVAGYLRSWSATARYVAANGDDPVTPLEQRLAPAWGGMDRPQRVSWPLTVLASRPNRA